MPAQTTSNKTAYYTVGDTAPPLRQQLVDGNNAPIDLTGHQVFIEIAYQRWSFYYSPTKKIVDYEIVVEAGVNGWVQYIPLATHLVIAGEFLYKYRIKYSDDTIQHVPPQRHLPLFVAASTGGDPSGSPP